MRLNRMGTIVAEEWVKTPQLRPNVGLDAWVIMPNQIHGIVLISDGRGTARRAPTMERFGAPVVGSLPTVVRAFKSATTKRINDLRCTPATTVWQRNYYEHVIRDEGDLMRARWYIAGNPAKWVQDEHHTPE
ncbi:MAG: hypothetical protein AB1714_29630 [Acidobacteriota bacterium]